MFVCVYIYIYYMKKEVFMCFVFARARAWVECVVLPGLGFRVFGLGFRVEIPGRSWCQERLSGLGFGV